MSGKSTLLRTVGVNAVLALAGAPVRARRLRLSPLALGATLRIHDSLQAGKSRFYAEITRLRQIVDRAAGRRRCCSCSTRSCTAPTRTTAASAPRRSSAAWSSAAPIGLVTTHDLALAERRRRAGRARAPTCTSRTSWRTGG